MKYILILALVAALSAPALSHDFASDFRTHGAWDVHNDPALVRADYLKTFDTLPLSGGLSKEDAPWSDSYWPNSKGSIAYRWFAHKKGNFRYRSPSIERARKMADYELAELSPAEKYDLFMGNYSYPTVKDAWSRSHWKHKSWEGICHGWAAASSLYPEPAAVTVVNADGIAVPFGSSDVKALLSYYYAWYAPAIARHVGVRCDSREISGKESENPEPCNDANAGAFHVLLANQLGLRKQAFVIDVDRGYEVWNQPVFQYNSTVLRTDGPAPSSTPGTEKRHLLSTTIQYTAEVYPDWEPFSTRGLGRTFGKPYHYWIDLNAQGEIIGGEWYNHDRPDFAWVMEIAPFEGVFAGLSHIYRPAKQPLPEPQPSPTSVLTGFIE